jgi:CHAD domain-containing protein
MTMRAVEPATRPAMVPPGRRRAPSSRSAREAAKPDVHPLGPLVQKYGERFSSLIAPVLAADDVEAVHDLRVVTRRLEQALIALCPEGLPKPAKRLQRALRRIRRALGTWRNCDVALAMAAERLRRTRSPRRRSAWNLVRQHLEQRRLEECIRARRKLLAKDLWDFAQRLQEAFRELLPATPADRVRAFVREGAEGAWARWREASARAEAKRDVESVHALRIATKRLRYQVELARELGEVEAEPLLEWCRALQERLGDWHDHQMLQQSIAEALARPQAVLSDLETVQVGLAELGRERRAFPPDDPAILAEAQTEAGHKAFASWLGAPAVSATNFTKP